MRTTLMTVLATVAALVAAAAASAAPSPSPSYQMAGLRTGGPSSMSNPFRGTALGSTGDRGFWQASVTQDPLSACSTEGTSCAITGGTFTLRSNNGSQFDGTFDSGSVQLASQEPGCGRQEFTLVASLSTTNGAEVLRGTLDTFRVPMRGTCTVLISTLQASLDPDGGTF